MTVSIEAKTRILRRRVAALEIAPDVVAQAEQIVRGEGMKLPNATESLRVEWLNDLIAGEASEFGLAARDPGAHFLGWVRVRARNRYHVTYRSVDVVARRLGADAASRFTLVAWPQEIAWAQRMRLDRNPIVATKAALFLRETEGQPGKVFERIADIFAEARLKTDYAVHVVHGMSPSEIRTASSVADFTPLFLRYAARAYADRLLGMSREKFEALAVVAARDEIAERDAEAGRQSAGIARSSPMRRMLPIIVEAMTMRLTANQLFVLENVFVDQIERGEVAVETGTGSPHAAFVSAIADTARRNAMLIEGAARVTEDVDSLAWEVVNLKQTWLSSLPDAYRRMTTKLLPAMESWQVEIAEDRREAPFDPVSDFGFFLAGEWAER